MAQTAQQRIITGPLGPGSISSGMTVTDGPIVIHYRTSGNLIIEMYATQSGNSYPFYYDTNTAVRIAAKVFPTHVSVQYYGNATLFDAQNIPLARYNGTTWSIVSSGGGTYPLLTEVLAY